MNESHSACRILDYSSQSATNGTGTHQRCYHFDDVAAREIHHLRRSRRNRQEHADAQAGGGSARRRTQSVETREPGGTATGEKIRRVLLDSATEGLSPLAEMALMFASRAQHIAEVIQPALDRGQIVLCDRFTDSTEAYQGSGRKLGSEAVLELHRVLCGDLQPDLTILLDSDPAMSVGRARRSE